MNLSEYFDKTQGWGVLATADAFGKVDAAMYARPHFMEDGTIAFVMGDRLTHANIQSNPNAAYLFIESGPGYFGKRLYLTRVREETDYKLVQEICRRCDYSFYKDRLSRFVVFFLINKILPLIGSGSE